MTEIKAPQPGPTGLPQFIRAEVERAIAKAVAPTGMSAHDGRALIGHDKLRYMLALIDSQAAKLAAIQAPEGGPDLRKAFESWALHTPPDDRTNWEVFQAGARAALAAQRQAATLPTTLTDEMRAVLTNERCVYGSADELYAALLAAAPAPQAPVAWCELTASGQIAYFDGKPMVMPGPVGNDCHPHPLYLGHAPQTKERT